MKKKKRIYIYITIEKKAKQIVKVNLKGQSIQQHLRDKDKYEKIKMKIKEDANIIIYNNIYYNNKKK